jgi:hypothetical protein
MRVLVLVSIVALVACASNKKAELIYEEPVTNVWTGGGPPPAQPQAMPPENVPPAANAPAGYGAPPQAAPPQGQPPAQATPPGYSPPAQARPQPSNQPQAPQLPPAPGWRSGQAPPQQAPPQQAPTDPSTATTVVVPDNNPTTQSTLKRRTGWVRGGFD